MRLKTTATRQSDSESVLSHCQEELFIFSDNGLPLMKAEQLHLKIKCNNTQTQTDSLFFVICYLPT